MLYILHLTVMCACNTTRVICWCGTKADVGASQHTIVFDHPQYPTNFWAQRLLPQQ
eukprot:m.355814 g.355814  ORF g.355814 m.355814 type:complete len:56 (-) comp17345_c0_seq1:94-261(-)